MPFLGETSTLFGGFATLDEYLISQSIRFNDDDSAYMLRTPSVAGNRKTWTFSCWFKLGSNLSSFKHLFNAYTDASNYSYISINDQDQIAIGDYISAANASEVVSNAVLRDTSAWYHLTVAYDSTESTSSNRIKAWLNGQLLTYSSSTYPSQNYDSLINSTETHNLGRFPSTPKYFDGLMALPNLVDGAALDYTSFAEFDADGYYNPIEFTGDGVTGLSGNVVPIMTGFTTPEGEVTGTTTANAQVWNIFDGALSGTYYVMAGSTGFWQYQFDTAKTIVGYYIAMPVGDTDRDIVDWVFEGSNDGSSYTTLDTVTGESWTGFRNQHRYFECDTTGSYTYYRVTVTANNGNGSYVHVQNMQMVEASTGFGTNGGQYDFNNSSFFGQDVKQEFTAPSVAFTDSAYDSTNTTSYTFSSMDIGAADDDRYVYACVGSSNTVVSPLTFQTVTIGGVSATQLGASNADPANNLQPYAIYVAKVPSGTTADVVVTLNSSPANCAVALYRAVGVGLGYVDLQSDNGSSPNSVSVDVPANGFILAHGNKNGETIRVTMTGVTEQYDFGGENDMAIFGGLNTAAGGTTQTVTVTTASGSYFGHLAVRSHQ